MKRSTAVLIAGCITAGMVFAASPASALSSSESEFVSRHNSIRAANGRGSLAVYSDLVEVARRHSARMAAAEDIWHNPNLTSEVKNWRIVGENVGMGPSVSDLMDAFMNSPTHRANILDPDYNQFGIGVVVSNGTIYVTVVFALRSGSTPRTTTTKPRTTTTKAPSTSTSRPRATTATAKPAAPAAPVTPAAPPPPPPPVRTVDMLERMLELDA